MKNYIKSITVVSMVLAMGMSACQLEEPVNPNQPTLMDGVVKDAQIPQLNNLVVGTLSNARAQMPLYIDAVGVIGREFYRSSGSDPRYVGDLLGINGAALDNNAFYTTNPYTARYATVKNVNILIDAVNNTAAITEEQRQGYLAFAKTVKAHELLLVLNQQYQNGIRVDVNDPKNLGPFLSYEASLEAIATLLNEAATHLDNAGEAFAFPLSSGFEGFDTPATFKQFNRALAARVAVYRGQFEQALVYLQESFLDLTGNYNRGVYHVYSASSGDMLNLLYLRPNATGDVRLVNPSFIAEAEANDNRIANKTIQREREFTIPSTDIRATHDVYVYKSNTDRVPVIRNEELVLIYAEAKIQTGDLPAAVTTLNDIRQNAGLTPYTGPVTQEALIDEMLRQRRYSLFFEGHRWIDMRRYNRLNQLPTRNGEVIHEQFPRPITETGA
jgi:hypothetical protein